MFHEYQFNINPVPASRPRVSRYGTYHLPTYREFRDKMKEDIESRRSDFTKSDGRLLVVVSCVVQSPKKTSRSLPRGDVDNYAKAVLDSLNGVTWTDDDQIAILIAEKIFGDVGHIKVEVHQLAESDES